MGRATTGRSASTPRRRTPAGGSPSRARVRRSRSRTVSASSSPTTVGAASAALAAPASVSPSVTRSSNPTAARSGWPSHPTAITASTSRFPPEHDSSGRRFTDGVRSVPNQRRVMSVLSSMHPITNIEDPRYVKAMSHPLRVRILALLDERTASPVELAGWLGATLGTVASHVRTPGPLGLIELVRETRVRGAVEHHYRSKERPRVSDEAWAEAPPIAKQAAVGSALQMISDHATAAAAAGGFDAGDTHLTRTMMRLDPPGREELSRAFVELLEKTRVT